MQPWNKKENIDIIIRQLSRTLATWHFWSFIPRDEKNTLNLKTWEGGAGGEAGSWRRHKRSWHVRTYSSIIMMMMVVVMMTMMMKMVVMEAVMTRLKSSWCSEQHVLVQLLFQSKPASISMEQVPFTPTVHWDALAQKAANNRPNSNEKMGLLATFLFW